MIAFTENLSHYNVSEPGREGVRFAVPHDYAGLRLDQVLQRLLPQYSRSRLQFWIRNNQVILDGKTAPPKQKVWGGEQIDILAVEQDSETPHRPEHIPLDVIFDDETILIINKPAGLVVHPGNGNRTGTMLNALLHRVPDLEKLPRAGIVHRLDKDTSGLLAVAKTLTAQTSLVRQFQARTIKREYLAVVHGTVEGGGSVDVPIGRHPINRIKMAVTSKGKPATTHYRVEKHFKGFTLLRCNLESGRTHQIRVHMQTINHPIVGDPTYQTNSKNAKLPPAVLDFPRQALHATKLELLHPQSKIVMSWQAELPEDIATLLAALENGA